MHVDTSDSRAEAQRFFELGMAHARVFECDRAIDLYTKSFAIYPNPSPLINRANLLSKRLKFEAALQDLHQAHNIDAKQGVQFQNVIAKEIERLVCYTGCIADRPSFIKSLETTGVSYVADRLIQVSFEIAPAAWDNATFPHENLDFFFFDELDNIKKFDNRSLYRNIQHELDAYPEAFIQTKISQAPKGFIEAQRLMYSLLCAHSEVQLPLLRDAVLYSIHEFMMRRDYGLVCLSTLAESSGLVREARDYIAD